MPTPSWTNHFHLVLETPEPTLSRGMKWMNGKYAQWFNRRHERSGHLFQGRFKGFLVEKESYLLALIRYVALNPVRAGMVKRPEEYPWSSYRATAGYEPAPPWLTTDWALAPFGADLATQQTGYRQFVDEGAGITRSPLEDAVGQLFLGTAPWIEKMRVLIESKPRDTEHPEAQRCAGQHRTPDQRPHPGRHQPNPGRGGQDRPLSARTSSTGSTSSNSTSRRCANGPRTSCRWPTPSSPSLPTARRGLPPPWPIA